MRPERASNGTRPRYDKRGDGWAFWHRGLDEHNHPVRGGLNKSFLMDDIDYVVYGSRAWSELDMFADLARFDLGPFLFEKTEDQLFAEYVVSDDKFATVAIFDRKMTEAWAKNERSVLSTDYQRDLCRKLGRWQPEGLKPRFYLVIGPPEGPWRLVHVDLKTGAWGKEWQLHNKGEGWLAVWTESGLATTRTSLAAWLRQSESAA